MRKTKRIATNGTLKSRLARLLTATLFLTSCATTRCDCPAWPTAGKAVAQELERLDVNDYPAVWEWLARLEKLRSQLQ